MKLKKTFIVKPTMDCNLRCEYCYEFRRNGECYAKQSLSSFDICSFMERVARVSPGAQILWLLHGGEPLVKCNATYLSQFIERMRSVRDRFGVDYQLALQTNATLLTDEYVEVLVKNQDLLAERIVSVSIDGSREITDRARRFVDARSSFDQVMRGISSIKRFGLKFSTISVIGSHNVDKSADVYSFIRGLGGSLAKMIPCYNFDESGNCEKLGVLPTEYAHFICDIFDLWLRDLSYEKSDWFVIDPIATVLAKLSKSFVTWCEFRQEKCDNFLSVYPDGELWLCDALDHKTMRDFGYLGNFFTMSDSELRNALERPCKLCKFSDFHASVMSDCDKCGIYPLCQGGCLPTRYFMNQKSSKLAENYCLGKRIMFDHIKEAYDDAQLES